MINEPRGTIFYKNKRDRIKKESSTILTVCALLLLLPLAPLLHAASTPKTLKSSVIGYAKEYTLPSGSGRCLPKECLKIAVSLKLKGDKTDSIELLYKLRRSWPGTIEAARAAVLLALFRIEAEKKEYAADQNRPIVPVLTPIGPNAPALNPSTLTPTNALNIEAIELLKEASALLGAIDGYIDLYRVQSYNATGKTDEALKIVNKRLGDKPSRLLSPLLKPLFLHEEAKAYNRSGLKRKERTSLLRLADEYPSNTLIPGVLLRAARLSWAINDQNSAYSLAARLRVDHPATPEAKEVQKVLQWVEQSTNIAAELSNKERFTRAKNLYKAALFKETIAELKIISKSLTAQTPAALLKGTKGSLYSDAVLLHALTLFRQKQYTKTVTLLKKEKSNLSLEKRPDALYWISLSALRLGKPRVLLGALKELDRTPQRVERAWALLFAGRVYERLGNKKKSEHFFKKLVNEPNSRPALHATWHLAWQSYTKGRYKESMRILNNYLDKREGSGTAAFYSTGTDKFTYWSARSAARIGLTKEAVKKYRTLCAYRTDSYYCQMANERLEELHTRAPRSAKAATVTAKSTEAAKELQLYRAYVAARELITLGLNTEAADELNLLAEKLGKSFYTAQERVMFMQEITSLFYISGDYYRGLKLYSKFYRYNTKKIDTGAQESTRTTEQAFSAYPMGVVDTVARMTKKRGHRRRDRAVTTDPLLVAAVMREESTFNPEAISHSGALGLMQIMPETGDFIAMKLRTRSPARAELIAPATNIRYGAWYLGYLAERFGNNVTLTIAGYNAGPSAAAKWAKDKRFTKLSTDEFIESIPYTETRRYTKRVLKSYTAYIASAGLDTSTRFSRPLTSSRAASNKSRQKKASRAIQTRKR